MKSERQAMWELCVDLATRISTVGLPDDIGDEGEALDSLYKVFCKMRETLYALSHDTEGQALDLYSVMNRQIRPIITRWHTIRLNGWTKSQRKECREELKKLQKQLRDGVIVVINGMGFPKIIE